MIPRQPDLDELDREIRDHIEEETLENIARGMSQDDARAAAIRKFGNVTRVREDVRAVWVPGWLDRLKQDARDASRHLRRNAAFSVAVVVTLALGIGLTTAIYSVVNAVLLRPLNYPQPDRIVWLTTYNERSKSKVMSDLDFVDWKAQAQSFEHMVAYNQSDLTIVADGEATRTRVVSASGGFWEMTGARAELGSLPDSNSQDVLVLSQKYFWERFHGDAGVIGRAVVLDGRQSTIGGVLPAAFAPQLPATAWRPGLEKLVPDMYRVMVLAPPNRSNGPNAMVRILQSVGELKPGVSLEQAQSELSLVHERNQTKAPSWFGKSTPLVVPLREQLVGASRFSLTMLLAAAGCVLLITCANVASLLMSRTSARQKEIALRMSVGSGPLRVVRQLLAESLAFALLGGAGGVLIATWLVGLVIKLMGPAVPRLTETTLDPTVLIFAIALSLLTALLFGLGPALVLCRTNVQEVLKEGVRSLSASRTRMFAGRAMVVTQLTLTVVLLIGASLMFKSVWQMTSYPPGFEPDALLTLRIDFTGPQYRDQAARHAYVERLLTTARTLPLVREAAITTGNDGSMLVREENDPIPQVTEGHTAGISAVSPAFTRLMGMTTVRGRLFEDADAEPVVLINEALARRDYATRDPIGRRIRMPFVGPNKLGTIVGVVSDAKYSQLDEDVKPQVLFRHADTQLYGVTLVLRIDGEPSAAAPGIRKAIAAIDPTLAVFSVQTVADSLAEAIAPRRFYLLLLMTFAIVALVLAMLGVYGVVAYAVAERTHEIGIRLALGAERARVVRMIVSQSMVTVIGGIAAGLIGAWAATRLIATMLYGVGAHDVPTFAITTLLLGAIAFVACAAPALRAARVDPVIALRAE